jgi:cold shock CspA family protein
MIYGKIFWFDQVKGIGEIRPNIGRERLVFRIDALTPIDGVKTTIERGQEVFATVDHRGEVVKVERL